jgi:heterotetrameric sarcosine oxidase gamma subunit
MTAQLSRPVIWRSALETRHAALDASWLDEHVHWPSRYAGRDAAADAAITAAGAGIADIGPLEEWLLRGPDAIAAVANLAGHATVAAGRVVPLPDHAPAGEAWILGPDEVLVLALIGASPGLAAVERLAADGVSVIEMTGARTTLGLAGPAGPAILAELCPVDTTPATMAPGDVIQAPLASVRAFIARRDAAGGPAYAIMIARDEAAYVWDAFVTVGAAHALTPVGPSAVLPAGWQAPARRRSR